MTLCHFTNGTKYSSPSQSPSAAASDSADIMLPALWEEDSFVETQAEPLKSFSCVRAQFLTVGMESAQRSISRRGDE